MHNAKLDQAAQCNRQYGAVSQLTAPQWPVSRTIMHSSTSRYSRRATSQVPCDEQLVHSMHPCMLMVSYGTNMSKASCSASGLGAYFVPNCPALRSNPNFQGPSLMLMRLKSNVIFLCMGVIDGQVGKLSMLSTLRDL